MNSDSRYQSSVDYVDALAARGCYYFTLAQLQKALGLSAPAARNALKRLAARNRVASPARGFEELARGVSYGGHPHHKRSPGDFGLTPPASPRPNKSLCDGVGIFERAEATRHLVEGIRHGTVSADADDGFPRHVWSLADDGRVLEARCDNFAVGQYHGYPLERSDPMADMVIDRWKDQDDGANAN